jgi:hypothetical protein
MKTIKIEKIEELGGKTITEISAYLDRNLSCEYIDMLNWPVKFPYKPACKFKIARSKDKLYLKFYVAEQHIKAEFDKDMENVWEDSCVEFFCRRPGQKTYYNFEFNCIGACVATERGGRDENVVPLSESQFAQIERFPSLGKRPFEERTGNFEWELTVAIPLKFTGMEDGGKIGANFYKCGDKTGKPHYLSWNLIATDQPDFHRPEFFGELEL